MLFAEHESNALKDYLVDLVKAESDADPIVLVNFMMALLKSDLARDKLKERCNEELSLFLDEKTESLVDRVFEALDTKSFLKTTNVPAQAKAQQESEDDDDDDDDTNFKRRGARTTEEQPVETSTASSTKRPLDRDSSSDNGPMPKQPRQDIRLPRMGNRPPKRCFDYDQKGYCLRGDNCPYDHGDNALVMDSMQPQQVQQQGYGNYQQSHLPGGPRSRGPRVAKEDLPYSTRYTPYSTRLVLDSIPDDKCNLDAVNEYFSKFGKLINLSVQPEHRRAFIQYGVHQQALAAYQSPTVIFGNRFVKVFWEKVDEAKDYQEYQERQRQASQPDPEIVKARAAQIAKANEERQKAEQERVKQLLVLQKQKQEQMEKRIQLEKGLMDRLAKAPSGSAEREEILATIHNLNQPVSQQQPPVSAAQQVQPTASLQPEQLPTTLDEKKAEMERLKAKLQQLEAMKKLTTARGAYGGRGAWPARGGYRSFNLDNRHKPAATGSSQPTAPEDSP
ncbi:hypothetical protein DM01DRAFT_1340016 [Hesseltinella vesiculosa]|uniref:C3H1-type domain-containing protein n=1 Tax=Hesseltinella vesiculosa TaxID=101127 RepID=A0A1X2G5F1_9FUNG|nr:hypothetical protein DM01DRAFT_1340016 [Hesseltinella vesiculosa]